MLKIRLGVRAAGPLDDHATQLVASAHLPAGNDRDRTRISTIVLAEGPAFSNSAQRFVWACALLKEKLGHG